MIDELTQEELALILDILSSIRQLQEIGEERERDYRLALCDDCHSTHRATA